MYRLFRVLGTICHNQDKESQQLRSSLMTMAIFKVVGSFSFAVDVQCMRTLPCVGHSVPPSGYRVLTTVLTCNRAREDIIFLTLVAIKYVQCIDPSVFWARCVTIRIKSLNNRTIFVIACRTVRVDNNLVSFDAVAVEAEMQILPCFGHRVSRTG